MAKKLNPQQSDCVSHDGSALVVACPGSGKTRVLAHRVSHELHRLESRRGLVAALTFTRKAAEQITSRLTGLGTKSDRVWTGTIHSFALDWILRPYAPYSDRLRRGFRLVNESEERQLLQTFRTQHDLGPFVPLLKGFDRDGALVPQDPDPLAAATAYHAHLQASRLIDFDTVLFLAYQLLMTVPGIAETLGAMFGAICVDEYQDTQDLQYGILAEITTSSNGGCTLFVVGDPDQAIYTSLGGVAWSSNQIRESFGLQQLDELPLTGNYRSSQRIIDFFTHFSDHEQPIVSLADYSAEHGSITFDNQSVTRAQLPNHIGQLVVDHIQSGIPPNEICVLAPQWRFVVPMARELAGQLPAVPFDAPGLSPFRGEYENVWFKLARLLLTDPEPRRYRTRRRWAADLAREFETLTGIQHSYSDPATLLRCINAISSDEVEGCAYLLDAFAQTLTNLGIDIESHDRLRQLHAAFFDGARANLANADFGIPDTVSAFRRCFGASTGVVIDTCHGIKGQEFDVVICFGLLRGRIPNWSRIIPKTPLDSLVSPEAEANRMLYVISSRAKRHLHLIAEHGHVTANGVPYDTTYEVPEGFAYDVL
ncbi:MAG: ATP-dependent helicase [Planctomycetota bacterium]